MAMVCVFVLKWATLNFEQVSEAAGWRQTGKHVCIGSVLNGLERERERPRLARGLMHPQCFI